MAAPSDQRRTPRIQPYVAACRVLVGQERRAGYVTDLSPHGCQVVSESEAPPVGAQVTLEVRLGHGIAHARLPAEVMWRKPATEAGRLPFGLTFSGLDPDQQQALQEIVDEFQRRAAEIET